jgi:uncharacterized membrane-anchored protein
MKLDHLPKITMEYWIVLIVSSILGANTGDFLSDILDFGHLFGLPILAVLFAVILIAEKLDTFNHCAYYWMAIIVVRSAATNIGDIGHDLHLNSLLVMSVLAATLMVTLLYWKKTEKLSWPESYCLATNPLYWWTMLMAGSLGTVVGDYFSYGLGLGNLNAACILGALVAVFLLFGNNGRTSQLLYYWTTVVCIRSAGTAAGDFFAHEVFGLEISTGVFVILFIFSMIALRQVVTSWPLSKQYAFTKLQIASK